MPYINGGSYCITKYALMGMTKVLREEMKELISEVNNNFRYRFAIIFSVDLDSDSNIENHIIDQVKNNGVTSIIVDFRNKKIEPILPKLFRLISPEIQFFDINKIYEDIFDRVPISLLRYDWFLENISLYPKPSFDFFKRLMDIIVAVFLSIVSLIMVPFVWLLIKLEGGGPVFTHQERIGKDNKLIKLIKFRTMAFNDGGNWQLKGKENYVTKVGAFLRNTRIDEWPQLWNVLRGDISLIGPRPEFAEPVAHYNENVPYYNVRHLIKPGLSGWAQIYHDNHPHHGTDIHETKAKLSYDLYYIKNRSIMLDVKIALRTVKALLSRSGV